MMLKKYLIKLDPISIRLISYNIKIKGFENAIEEYLRSMDCTTVYPNGDRPRQTINYGYNLAISSLYFILDHSINRKEPIITKEKYKEIEARMNDIHSINIQFEKDNPPIVYKKSKTVNKTTNTISKTDKVPKEVKVKKPTKAELKLAERVSKLNKLSMNFKIKSVDTDDTIQT